MDHLEEIRLRINIEDLVGGYVQLKKAGRNLRGLCPFHGEKTPSFMVSPEKGIAYCFGCHQGGDIFKFTQLVENVSFVEAVHILAEKANVPVPQKMPALNNKRLKVIEINKWTVQFYEEIMETNQGRKGYFKDRGLTDETIKLFKLGFAPDSYDQLKDFLLKKGFEKKELIESAVASQRSIADQNIFDRFRNRVIFPIFDHQDNPVGFSGRIMGEGEPKYMNSPETPAYNKSGVLYGLNWSKKSIKEKDQAIFMEGYMDVIAAYQAGTENVVATCGTALTPQQLKLISRYTKNITFAFDRDAAGMEATFRAIELAQLAELNIKIIKIQGGKDPDEAIQKNLEEWKKSVENPITIMDFYFEYTFSQFDKDSIEGKKKIMDFVLPLIKLYKTDVERGFYLNKLALELKTDVNFLWNDLKNARETKTYQGREPEITSAPKKRIFSKEEYLLGFILDNPEMYEEVSKNLIDNIALNSDTEKFYNLLKKVYTLGSSLDMSHFKEELSEEDREKIEIYSMLIEESYPDFSEGAAAKEVKNLIRGINQNNVKNAQKDFEIKIRTSEDLQEKKVLLSRYNELLKLSTKI